MPLICKASLPLLRLPAGGAPDRAWLLNDPFAIFPICFYSYQSAAMCALEKEHLVQEMAPALYRRSSATLEHFSESARETLPLIFPHWFNERFKEVLNQLRLFLRMFWFMTISGAWCTSVRLHSITDRPCIFGCIGSKDGLVQYSICLVLWQFAMETLKLPEASLALNHRLCH